MPFYSLKRNADMLFTLTKVRIRGFLILRKIISLIFYNYQIISIYYNYLFWIYLIQYCELLPIKILLLIVY